MENMDGVQSMDVRAIHGDNEELRGKIGGIRLCLAQLEKEAKECGFGLSAHLIKVAAVSLSYKQDEQDI